MQAPRRRLFAPVSAGALALGLAIGLALPLAAPWFRKGPPAAELPSGYVAVLAAPEGSTGLVVTALRDGRVLDTRLPVPPDMPAGRTLYLWMVDAAGFAQPLGPVPAGLVGQMPLPDQASTLLADVVSFGVSVERAGDRPNRPGSAFVFRGQCGRLWPSPAHAG